MKIKYGNIEANVNWEWPTKEVYESWKYEFLMFPEAKYIQAFLVGGFQEKLKGNREHTPDVDIVLIGNIELEKIESLIYKGIKLGLDKYGIFFDILWFETLPIYSQMNPGETKKIKVRMPSDKWIVDDKVEKIYKSAKQLRPNLWEVEIELPNEKQKKLLSEGYVYAGPELLTDTLN
jgi:hypothetical protein